MAKVHKNFTLSPEVVAMMSLHQEDNHSQMADDFFRYIYSSNEKERKNELQLEKEIAEIEETLKQNSSQLAMKRANLIRLREKQQSEKKSFDAQTIKDRETAEMIANSLKAGGYANDI